MTLRVWGAPETRPTRDIDFLAYGENSPESLARVVREICAVPVADDGIGFDRQSVSARKTKEGADYEGVRVRFTGFLAKARIPMQLDIGFGDVILPEVEESHYPALLEATGPVLLTSPREAVVAEKFQAMVALGSLNSSMKDFFDLWLLARHFDFSGPILSEAIAATFRNRRTEIDTNPIALQAEFFALKRSNQLWEAFVRRSRLEGVPASLDAICPELETFLLLVARSISKNVDFTLRWPARGPWMK